MTVDTAADTSVAVVRAGFDAFAGGDFAGFADMFRPDATWNHRNEDRFEGVHSGVGDVMAFLAESGQLSAGTLSAVPLVMTADAEGHVLVLVHLTATRPDGRSLDDQQILSFVLDGDLVRSVDQYVGQPAAVKAFWA